MGMYVSASRLRLVFADIYRSLLEPTRVPGGHHRAGFIPLWCGTRETEKCIMEGLPTKI